MTAPLDGTHGPFARDDLGRPRRRPILGPLRAVVVLGGAALIFVLVNEPVRVWEGNAVLAVASWLSPSVERSSSDAGAIISSGQGAFAVTFSTSCSVAALFAALVPAALVLIRAPLRRRLLALGVGLVAVVVFNASRVLGVVLIGTRWGSGPMVVLHDWVGTLLYAVSGMVGLLLMAKLSATRADRELVAPDSSP